MTSLKTFSFRFPLLSLSLAISVALAAGCDGSSSQEVGAPGVAINNVAIYQSLERMLVRGGKTAAPAAIPIPLLAERAALVRVFYVTNSSYDQKEVTARLTITGHDPIVVKTTLSGSSAQDKLDSTINFELKPEMVNDPLEYKIEILQERDAADDNAQARFPAEGLEKVTVEGKKNTLRVMLVPFRYKFDASNRLPDTSPEQLQRFKQRFLDLYPVSDVEIELHPPIDWGFEIKGNGEGWQQVGLRLLQVRADAKVSDDTYLYGIFNPAPNLATFCGFGCLLGVTLLNADPPDTGIVQLRLALGIGFNERATDTAAHEIGHAHGRGHANCGPGLDPRSIDLTYPKGAAHQGGKIGLWGYDMAGKKLIPPTWTDIMGYCDNQWISDHNFVALYNRGKNVNLASWQMPEGGAFGYDVIALDGAGKARWSQLIERRRPLISGEGIDVVVDDARSMVRAQYYRFDHIPGGWLFVPRQSSSTATYRFSLDGRTFSVQR